MVFNNVIYNNKHLNHQRRNEQLLATMTTVYKYDLKVYSWSRWYLTAVWKPAGLHVRTKIIYTNKHTHTHHNPLCRVAVQRVERLPPCSSDMTPLTWGVLRVLSFLPPFMCVCGHKMVCSCSCTFVHVWGHAYKLGESLWTHFWLCCGSGGGGDAA